MLDDVRKPESERREWIVEVLKDIDGKHTGFLHKGELVRCRDCRHREKYPCDEIEFYECGHIRYKGTKCGVTDDFFCADGEREEDE